MKRALVLLVTLLLVAGCNQAPTGATSVGDGWSYVKGPHGEDCLAYETGSLNNKTTSVTCKDVWPSATPK